MITDFYLEPASGELDLESIEAFLNALPFTVRDVKKPTTFMVAEDAEILDEAVAERQRDDQRFPMTVLLIDVHPKRIDISYRLSPLDSGRAFVRWLREHQAIRVRDEDYNDVTAQVDPNLDLLFGSSSP